MLAKTAENASLAQLGSSGMGVGPWWRTPVRRKGAPQRQDQGRDQASRTAAGSSHCGWRHLQPRLVKGRAVTRARPRRRRPLTSLLSSPIGNHEPNTSCEDLLRDQESNARTENP